MEEDGQKCECIKEEINEIADTFSRLGRKDDTEPLMGKNNAPKCDINGDFLDNNF